MKKIIFIAVSLFTGITLSAQVTNFNALRLGQNPYVTSAALFSQTFYEGSARTSAMGNAFISLGGDIGSLAINPAASGIYRYSEFSITPAVNLNTYTADYLSETSTQRGSKIALPSVGYVGNISSLKRGGSSIKFGFAINRTNDLNSRFTVRGSTDQSSWLGAVASSSKDILPSEMDLTSSTDKAPFYSGIPWKNILAWNTSLLDLLPGTNNEYVGATENIDGELISVGGLLNQSFSRERTGNQSEFLVNIGGNIGSKLFIGANIGIQTLNYTDIQEYREQAASSTNFQTGFQHMNHYYWQNTNGIGLNAKLGLIFVPVGGLRIGATITTPTFLSLTEQWEEEVSSSFDDGYKQSIISPTGEYSYALISPLKLGAGISYVFGNIAIISADIEGVPYGMTRLSKSEDGVDQFSNENDAINDEFRFGTNLRIGAEVKPVKSLALRAGYSYYQSAEKNNPNDFRFISAGVGFISSTGFFADITLQHRLVSEENLKLYQNYSGILSPDGVLSNSANKLLVTLGFRF